jgi:hypothetical protein
MLGLDERIVDLAGGSWLLVLAIALLLGLRHATDPDHLIAVSMLVADDERTGARRARRLGMAWGLGHATTLCVFGMPVALFGAYLPGLVQRSAEVAVGVMIVAVALRLMFRCRPHHPRPDSRRRTARDAFGIGMVHGAGGSAGVGLLVVVSVAGDAGLAALCLAILAIGATASMTLLSSTFGYALARGALLRNVAAAMPALGCAGVLFGAWYALAALWAVHYPL